jgi:hypothetical protein
MNKEDKLDTKGANDLSGYSEGRYAPGDKDVVQNTEIRLQARG